MGARVIQLAEVRASRMVPHVTSSPQTRPAVEAFDELSTRFHFWSGASGKRYVHSIYSLIGCPELPAGNFMLVRRASDGRRTALSIGRLAHVSASMNLAEVRLRGAQLGANEVHVHLLAETVTQMRQIEFDLRTGQCLTAVDLAAETRH